MVLRGPDRTGRRGLRVLRSRRGKRPDELHVRARVEPAQLLDAQLADPLRVELTAGPVRLPLDSAHDLIDVRSGHGALVRGPQERVAELRAVETLALPAPLDHVKRIGLPPLGGREAPPAAPALAPSAHDLAARRVTGLEDVRGGAAARAGHEHLSLLGMVFRLRMRPYM